MNNLLNAQNLAILGNNKEQVAKWKEEKKLKERTGRQTLKQSKHERIIQGYSYYSPSYSQGGIHTDTGYGKASSYSKSGYSKNPSHSDTHKNSNPPHTDRGYSKNPPHTNKGYSKNPSHTDRTNSSYGPHKNHLLLANHINRVPHSKRHSNSNPPHSDSHSNSNPPHSNSHSNSNPPHTDSGYSKNPPHSDSHTNSTTPHTNTHSNSTSPHTNTGGYHVNSPSTVKKYEHNNYVPSRPEVLLGGSISDNKNILTGQVTLDFISYDRNADGYGDNDAKSKDVLYDFQIRRVQDLKGNTLNENWQTLITNGINDSFTFNVEGKKSGIYEGRLVAKNVPRKFDENGDMTMQDTNTPSYDGSVTVSPDTQITPTPPTEINKPPEPQDVIINLNQSGEIITYESEPNNFMFTIANNNQSEIKVLNGNEFANYSYGKYQAVSPNNKILEYLNEILYQNGTKEQQKGLFVEVSLTDMLNEGYHKATAKLVKDGKTITSKYNVIFELGADGMTQKKGSKKGVVFIPIEDMLDNGIYKGATIELEVTEYVDEKLTSQLGKTEISMGVDELDDILKVNLDGEMPTAVLTPADSHAVVEKLVNITTSDNGLGVMKSYYQVVKSGEKPLEQNYMEFTDTVKKILNQKGKWDIYVKVVDKAGNTKTFGPATYEISQLDGELFAPIVSKPKDTIKVQANLGTNLPIKKVEFWIQHQTTEKVGTLVKAEGENKLYETNIYIPDNCPVGNHIIFGKVYLEDGTTKTFTKPIYISDGKNIEDFKEISFDVFDSYPRFISKEYLWTLNADSRWVTNSAYKTQLENVLNNNTPIESFALKDRVVNRFTKAVDRIGTSATEKERLEAIKEAAKLEKTLGQKYRKYVDPNKISALQAYKRNI